MCIFLGRGCQKGPSVADAPSDFCLHIAGFAVDSRVNGPGRRVVVWVQGCSLGCTGCFNPDTHPENGGEQITAAALADRIVEARRPETVGVTISGGEPFQQAHAVAAVLDAVGERWSRATRFAFTGYRLETLRSAAAPPGSQALLARLDYLVDGRFDPRRPSQRPWRGSANQRLWNLGEQPLPDPTRAEAELHISDAGQVLLSGHPPPRLWRAVRALSG